MKSLNAVQWSIVEQPHFVECGKNVIEDNTLKFYYTIEDCIQDINPKCLILSGVIQCLNNPYDWINEFLTYEFEYIIFDRTAFIKDEHNRLTIESVPESIYKASYPSWFFNYSKFTKIFLDHQYNRVVPQ
ncbi:hypothetical protein C2W62_45710 [Candidatus Entotheonella serta]|nr:hypothetical protein C2W62_45710 [Candidatus Entotheonella serta]